ncbi:MAG: DNA repair protein RecO [Oscillospiraceae bacterium]|nr:DNA repair protein RecO [Oscillospiraceae bacterium]
MQTTAMGLVLKETKLGEADRIITMLTDRFGLIRASARGSRNLKNKLFSSTGMFCYSEFSLFTQKGNYYVDEAALQKNFFGLRNSVEALGVAAYIAELVVVLEPHRPEEIQELLRLSLNSLYLLSEGKADPRLVKAVFELRAVAEAGYRPDLVACADCSRFEDKKGFFFDNKNGRIFCEKCAAFHCHDVDTPLSVVTAMRHSIYADLKKVFSFTLSEDALRIFTRTTEDYVLHQLETPLKTLDFLRTVLN